MNKKSEWVCGECGYHLPKGSDLLKVCPNCDAFGKFERVI